MGIGCGPSLELHVCIEQKGTRSKRVAFRVAFADDEFQCQSADYNFLQPRNNLVFEQLCTRRIDRSALQCPDPFTLWLPSSKRLSSRPHNMLTPLATRQIT